MKKLVLMTVLTSAFMSTTVHAEWQPFSFGIGMCEYAYHERTDSILWGVKMGSTMSDDVYKKQAEYCSSKKNMDSAKEALEKYKKQMKESNEQKQQYTPQPKDENFNRGMDIFNACVAGAKLDTKSYFNILSKYKGNKEVYVMGKAYDYGRVVARSPRDCTNYVMGR